MELRRDNKKLAEELSDKIQLFRDKGVIWIRRQHLHLSY
jgi:hypothetical protein